MNIRADSNLQALLVAILIGISFAFTSVCLSAQAQATSVLPKPTGAHPVGTAIFHLTDPARKNSPVSPAGSIRELTAQVWYPAKSSKYGNLTTYIPDSALISAMKKDEYNNVTAEVLNGWQSIRTNSLLDAPIAKNRMPLLFFSHGFGMSRSNYTSIIEELASHGYIVVAIDHPSTGFTILPGGRVLSFSAPAEGEDPELVNGRRIDDMVRDVRLVLEFLTNRKREAERFANHIDVKRIGMLGHSLGGATAIRACQRDARFKACANLDGDLWGTMQDEGVSRPFLVMLNEPPESRRPPAAVREQRDKGWTNFILKKRTAAFVVKIAGMNHFSFSDFPFVVPEAVMKKAGAEITPRQGHEIVTRVLRAFFSQYLDTGADEPIRASVQDYPEVTFKAY